MELWINLDAGAAGFFTVLALMAVDVATSVEAERRCDSAERVEFDGDSLVGVRRAVGESRARLVGGNKMVGQ